MQIDLKNIPDKPGCYLYKDRKGVIIYVGKAISLNKRVTSYFSTNVIDIKTKNLVSHISDMEYIITKNEVEALILENNLIKKHKPKYNINLKDSKRYAYIMITGDEFPRLMIARNKSDNGKFYGPFTSAEQRDKIIKILRMLFKVRTCKRMSKKPCLRYHINLCTAPCAGFIDKQDYNEKIRVIEQFLKGDIKNLTKGLEIKMGRLSRVQNFEQAIEIRDTIAALKRLSEKQAVETQNKHDQDVINYLVADGHVYLALLNVMRGILINKSEFEFDWTDDFLGQFISQYYADNPVPKEIIIPKKVHSSLQAYLILKRNHQMGDTNIHYITLLTIPKLGQKKELLDLALINVENAFRQAELSVKDIQLKLKMQTEPRIIECFDISNLQGTDSVGSMVQFRNGKPDKRNYRRFRIKTIDGIDDYSMIQEVVKRRYSRLIKEGKEMPDLIIIDGGKGHLNAALEVLKKLAISIPMISLAKQYEEVYVPGRKLPLRLDKRSYALKLMQNIRDEAHRFAISYHRLLRKKRILS